MQCTTGALALTLALIMLKACSALPGVGDKMTQQVREDFATLVEARLRVVADCTNQQLALAAAEESVLDWPPLHHADVCAWSRAVQTVMEGPEELPDIWGNLGKDTGATKANASVKNRNLEHVV